MAQLVVRHLEENVKSRLRRRAIRHGHSMEEEVRATKDLDILLEGSAENRERAA